ncbi:MAG: HAD hydrolase family protein, partial [Myxococcales bacterium]|nr:HAD hydrolase family protein [Myxococcales bacterium]
ADLLPLVRDLQAAHGPALQLHLFDDLYTRPWSWLTMHAGTATKGRAVDRLMTEASLADHRLVAFGDQLNDLPLFERADHAVATANAVPDVLEAADEVIGAHHEDAVVRWLEQHA